MLKALQHTVHVPHQGTFSNIQFRLVHTYTERVTSDDRGKAYGNKILPMGMRLCLNGNEVVSQVEKVQLSPVHTSCECEANVDVTNSQQIICSSEKQSCKVKFTSNLHRIRRKYEPGF